MTYKILEDFLPDVEKKLNRIAKKCQKYGNDFVYEILGEEILEKKNEDGKTEFYKFILVNVEGTAKIADWECIAVLEINPEGNIIKKINTEMDVPERFRHTENVCEHCNSMRFRNNLYIIHNVVTDEWKQVGKSCLQLYTNGLNAEYVTAYMDAVTTLEENHEHFDVHGKRYYEIAEILGYATEIIDKVGYFNSDAIIPTKSLVGTMMMHRGDLDWKVTQLNKDMRSYGIHFSKKDFFKSDTSDRVEKISEYWKNLESDSDFIHNVKSMLNSGYVRWENVGFIVYLPEGYRKHLEKEAEINKMKAERAEEINEFFGEVGKRYKDVKVKSARILNSFETQFGITYLTKIILEDNHVLTWFGSGIEDQMEVEKDGLLKYVPCIPETVSYTVKEFKEYKGVQQTVVTRCRFKYRQA